MTIRSLSNPSMEREVSLLLRKLRDHGIAYASELIALRGSVDLMMAVCRRLSDAHLVMEIASLYFRYNVNLAHRTEIIEWLVSIYTSVPRIPWIIINELLDALEDHDLDEYLIIPPHIAIPSFELPGLAQRLIRFNRPRQLLLVGMLQPSLRAYLKPLIDLKAIDVSDLEHIQSIATMLHYPRPITDWVTT